MTTSDEAVPIARVRVDVGTTHRRSTIAAVGVLFLGIVPNVVLEFARDATQLLAG